MTLLMHGALQVYQPPPPQADHLWLRREHMIGCPRGEGEHPLAAMINAGCLSKWMPALISSLACFELKRGMLAGWVGGGVAAILLQHSIWMLKVLKHPNSPTLAPLLQLLTAWENKPPQQGPTIITNILSILKYQRAPFLSPHTVSGHHGSSFRDAILSLHVCYCICSSFHGVGVQDAHRHYKAMSDFMLHEQLY